MLASHIAPGASNSVPVARAMDAVDLTQVANQLGTAVLKASSGVVVKATGELAGPDGEAKLATLLQLLQVREVAVIQLCNHAYSLLLELSTC
jgi:hypothetical protein